MMAAFRYDRTRHSSLVSHLTSESGRQNHVHSQSDPAGLQAALRTYFQTFPDFHLEVEDRISSGDKIVARLTLTAAHNSPVQLERFPAGLNRLVFSRAWKSDS